MSDQSGYGTVSTDASNELLEFVEKFGSHDQQYAVLISTLIGFAKATNTGLVQLRADVNANWDHIPAPTIMLEN